MKDDVIVEEVRSIRREIFKKCNYDLDIFYERIKENSKKLKENMKLIKKTSLR